MLKMHSKHGSRLLFSRDEVESTFWGVGRTVDMLYHMRDNGKRPNNDEIESAIAVLETAQEVIKSQHYTIHPYKKKHTKEIRQDGC